MPRLVGDRAPGVTMVVADHESAPIREHLAEALLPPEHRAADAHYQEDRRIPWIPKSLCAELDAVRFDQPLGHHRPSSPSKRSLRPGILTSLRACRRTKQDQQPAKPLPIVSLKRGSRIGALPDLVGLVWINRLVCRTLNAGGRCEWRRPSGMSSLREARGAAGR